MKPPPAGNRSQGAEPPAPFPVHRAFLPIALAAGVLYALINPPFQAPDESAHWWRAIYIANGAVVAGPGDMMPRAYVETVRRFHDGLKLHVGAAGRLKPGDVLALFRMPLDPADRVPLRILTANIYTPVPYLAQIPAVLAGQALSLPPIAAVYLGRLLNLLAWAWLTRLALKTTPVCRWGFFLLALMPMTVHQAASLSADGPVIALAFLYTALVLKLACLPPGAAVSRPQTAALALLAALAILAKPNFALLLLPALVPGRLFRRPASRLLFLAAVAGPALAAEALWGRMNGWALAAHRTRLTGLDFGGQAMLIVREPMRFLSILAATLRANGPEYCVEFVGRLGWLNAALPPGLVAAWAGALVLSCALAGGPEVLRPRQRAAAGLVFLACALTVFVVLWISETPPGQGTVGGVQGRYFIPFAPLLLAALDRGPRPVPRRLLAAAMVALAALAHAAAIRALCVRYYGPPPDAPRAGMHALAPKTRYALPSAS